MEGLGTSTVADWATVPRGNTQRHVNRDILRHLLGQPPGRFDQAGLRWLDIPCGAGELWGRCGGFFRLRRYRGADVRPTAPAVSGPLAGYAALDLNREFTFE